MFGHVRHMVADTGYFSAANTENCEAESVIPLLACGREAHHPQPGSRFADAGKAPAATANAVTGCKKTAEGKSIYAKRKSTVEPVSGVIKEVKERRRRERERERDRQFLFRVLKKRAVSWGMGHSRFVLATI